MAKVEKSIVDVLLNRPTLVNVCGEEYKVPPLTLETIILASEAVAGYRQSLDRSNYVGEVFRIAREYRDIGNSLAILILGADNLTEIIEKKVLWLRFRKTIDRKKILSDKILKMTPKSYEELLTTLSKRREISDFFQLTASLIEINIIAPTKEAVETTASGPS